jgi:hypothetical protein
MAIVYNTSIVRNSLVLHLDAANRKSYPGTGTLWSDMSGNGYNGVLTDVTYLPANGGVLDFDITATGVCDTQADILDLGSNDFTWEVWVSTDAHSASNQTLIEKGETSPNRGYGLYIDAFASSNRPTFRYSFNGTSYNFFGLWDTSGPMIPGTFYQVVLTRTGGTLRGYNNGVFNSQRGDLSTTAIFNSSEFLQFGATNNFNWLDGKLSTIRFYNRALTALEVQQNFEALRGRFGI